MLMTQRLIPGSGYPLFLPLFSLFWLLALVLPVAADPVTGEQIYKQQCASCHGAAGEGTEDYPRPLTGDRSVAQLTRLIVKRMPKDAAEKCVGEEAEKVSAYIYNAFYSRIARERNKPPRIALARLTVGQYQNTLADLIGSFRAPGQWGDKRGLNGEYFTSRRISRRSRALQRLDPQVQFDFKEGSPAEGVPTEEFAIRWQGALFARETGSYEFIIRTENGARLWVNDTDTPLIDAWVRSGTEIERRASLPLLGGRAYPLRLEIFKSRKAREKTASIALAWKPPHGVEEVIPARCLSPEPFPETYLVSTAFPPDDRSLGWERGTTVSKAWDEATTDAALDAASYVATHLAELAGVSRFSSDREARVRTFLGQFAERAFRRPLTSEQKRFFLDRQFEAAPDTETAVKRVVLLTLKSPRFLYPEIGPEHDAYEVAARLSYGLWDSLPDQQLLDAAANGKLETREQVAQQAERMLGDPRARDKLRAFLLHWLQLEQGSDLAKDPKRFPGFSPALVSDLRTSLELFLDEVVWSEKSDFRQLLLADQLYLNGRLARYYGANLPEDAPFQKVTPEGGKRAGVLTHPYMLAKLAYTGSTSPIHRGVFVARGVLGVTLRPPPNAFVPLPADLHPTLTTRERVSLQTRPTTCQACHGVINPLGFTLEHFDAVGRYREEDNGKPVDATGSYETRAGEEITFSGSEALARFLANSDEVHAAFVEQLFHHLVKQPIRAYGPDRLLTLRQSFAKNDFNIRKLAVEIMTVAAFRKREAKPPGD